MKPEMRFKGFAEEWKKKKIIDIAPLQRGFDLVNKNIIPGKYPIGYSNGILGYHNEFKAKGPGVFTGRSGTIGNVHFTAMNYWPHNTSLWVSDFKDNDEKFIFYLYKTINLKYYGAGSGVPTLNRNDVHSLIKYIPKYDEQKKIASFLTLLERKIEKQQEKIEELDELKECMVQKICTGEIRFKDEDGAEFPKWKKEQLKDIAEIVGGGTPSTREESYWGGSIPWFTPTEISKSKYLNNSKRTITESGLSKSSAKLLPVGTILLTTRATLGEMAIATVPVTTNQGFQSIIPNDRVLSEFIYYLQPQIKKHCYQKAAGSTFLEINKSSLETFTTYIPLIKEQMKIVEFLSSLDLKIVKEKEKMSKLRKQKKAFMQQMFI